MSTDLKKFLIPLEDLIFGNNKRKIELMVDHIALTHNRDIDKHIKVADLRKGSVTDPWDYAVSPIITYLHDTLVHSFDEFTRSYLTGHIYNQLNRENDVYHVPVVTEETYNTMYGIMDHIDESFTNLGIKNKMPSEDAWTVAQIITDKYLVPLSLQSQWQCVNPGIWEAVDHPGVFIELYDKDNAIVYDSRSSYYPGKVLSDDDHVIVVELPMVFNNDANKPCEPIDFRDIPSATVALSERVTSPFQIVEWADIPVGETIDDYDYWDDVVRRTLDRLDNEDDQRLAHDYLSARRADIVPGSVFTWKAHIPGSDPWFIGQVIEKAHHAANIFEVTNSLRIATRMMSSVPVANSYLNKVVTLRHENVEGSCPHRAFITEIINFVYPYEFRGFTVNGRRESVKFGVLDIDANSQPVSPVTPRSHP